MTQFILLFASLLFLSAIAINGFYSITRGDWYKKANGTKFWDGMIFSFWSKFLQQHTLKYETYSGDEFLKQFAMLKDFFTNPNSEILEFGTNAVIVRKFDQKKASMFYMYALSKGFLINIQPYVGANGDKEQMAISVFKEIKEYKIPIWIQAPLGQCITCMSSFYGTLAWIFWYQILLQVQKTYPTLVSVSLIEMPILSKIGLWIVFCISLAYLNPLFFNINHKLNK